MGNIEPRSSTDEVSSIFVDKYIFCCATHCPSWTVSIGSGLGYMMPFYMVGARLGLQGTNSGHRAQTTG